MSFTVQERKAVVTEEASYMASAVRKQTEVRNEAGLSNLKAHLQ